MTPRKYEGEERRSRERWKFNKEVSLADLVSFVSAVIAVGYAWSTLDKRISVLESDKQTQAATDARQDADSLRYQARIDSALAEINHKLDRLMERR